MTADVKKELLEIVDRIAQINGEMDKIQNEHTKIRDRIMVMRAEIVIDIGTAKDETGKPLYSNQKLRDAALTLKLADHQEFQEVVETRRALSDKLRALAIEHNRLVDRKEILMIEMGSLPSSDDAQRLNRRYL